MPRSIFEEVAITVVFLTVVLLILSEERFIRKVGILVAQTTTL